MSIPVSELIGRSLRTLQQVAYKAAPNDAAQPIGQFPAGSHVGVIYSWLDPQPGAAGLYWQFRTQSGRFYYVAHGPGLFDLEHLVNQGVQTSAQLREAQRRADMNVAERFLEDNADLAKKSVNVLVYSIGFGIIGFAVTKGLR